MTKCFAGIAFAAANMNLLWGRAVKNDNLRPIQVWLPFLASVFVAVSAFIMVNIPESFEGGNKGVITFGVLIAAALGSTMGITSNTYQSHEKDSDAEKKRNKIRAVKAGMVSYLAIAVVVSISVPLLVYHKQIKSGVSGGISVVRDALTS